MIYISRTVPSILNDTKFLAYGGTLGEYTSAQRCLAYTEAELAVEKYLNTYLMPTTVTGTYPWPSQSYDWRLRLGVNYLRSINSVVPQSEFWANSSLVDGAGYAFIKDADSGVVDLRMSAWCNSALYGAAYDVRVVYTAGFPYPDDPLLLAALTQLAKWYLTYLFNPDDFQGGAGDPAIQSWSSLDYSESRGKLYDTVFGSSPIANSIARLLKVHKVKPALALGR